MNRILGLADKVRDFVNSGLAGVVPFCRNPWPETEANQTEQDSFENGLKIPVERAVHKDIPGKVRMRQVSAFRRERVIPERLAHAQKAVAPMDIEFGLLVSRNLTPGAHSLGLRFESPGNLIGTGPADSPLAIARNHMLSFTCHAT
jgi:hypothetical protein